MLVLLGALFLLIIVALWIWAGTGAAVTAAFLIVWAVVWHRAERLDRPNGAKS